MERGQEDREGRLFPRNKGKPPPSLPCPGIVNYVTPTGYVGQLPALSRICAEIPLA